MKLDLKSFKKIEASDECTVLQHDKGHELTIAHRGLSPEFKKELDELPIHKAKGGFSKYAQKYDPSIKGSVAQQYGARPVLPGHKMNEAGKIVPAKNSVPSKSSDKSRGNPMAGNKNTYTEPPQQGVPDPVDVVSAALNREAPPFGPLGAPEYHSPPCINPSCKSYGKPHPNCRCYGGKMGSHGGYAEGGEVEAFCTMKKPHQKGCEYFKAGGMAEGEAPGVDPTQLDQAPPIPDATPAPEPQATPEPSEDVPGPTPQPLPSPDGQQSSAPGDVAAAPTQDQSQQPVENSPAAPEPMQKHPSPVEHFEAKKNSNIQQLGGEAQAFQNDLNAGHITPEAYSDLFAKKSTLGKIGTIFGLLIGGAGAGLAHQPNMLLEMMGKEIQNDLQAQEQSATNKQNYLRINQQALVNQASIKSMNTETALKARALANINMNMAAFHKLSTMANDPKLNPAQRAQAQQSLAMVYQAMNTENSNIMDKAAAGSALLGVMNMGQGQGGGGQPNTMAMKSGLFGQEPAKMGEDIESKTIPGVPGRASYPLSNGEKEGIGSMVQFDKELGNFTSWAQKHSGDLSPSDKRYGQALAAQLQAAYRQATHGGVYKEGEQNFISKIISDNPTAFFNKIRVMPQLKAVRDDLHVQLDQNLKNKGFPGYAVRNPKDGRYYVRNKEGTKMVPVK